MSSIKQRIQDDIITAMREKNTHTRDALRLMMASIKNWEIETRDAITDDQVLDIIQQLSKKNTDAIEQFQQAGRQALADKEQFELDTFKQYLPDPLSDTAVNDLIQEAIAKTQAQSMKDMSKVMGVLQPAVKGRVDMRTLSQKIKDILNASDC